MRKLVVNPDLARKVPIVVTNSSPSTVHAGQQLGFVYVCDECVGMGGFMQKLQNYYNGLPAAVNERAAMRFIYSIANNYDIYSCILHKSFSLK